MTRILMNLIHYLQNKSIVHVSAILSFLILSCLNVNNAFADNKIYGGTKVKILSGTNGISVKDFVINGGATFSNTGVLVLKEDIVNGNLLPDLIGNVSFISSHL